MVHSLHGGKFSYADFFMKINLFSKNSFGETFFQKILSADTMQSVKWFGSKSGPDLGLNCLQRYQQTIKVRS